MRTRRAEASSPNSDPQYFWNEYLQRWTDLRLNCIAEAHLPLCRYKPSKVNFKPEERISKLNINLRADLLTRWTQQEKELFTQRFTEVGKDFQLIADALPSKTVAQCIQYYYLTKHQFCYKKLRKKAIDEENGTRFPSRRAKSCGYGKESTLFSQRLENGERNAKGKLRKTYSCPEPNREKRIRKWKDLDDHDCCRASRRKSIVKEPSYEEHGHPYDGSTTIKRKRRKDDVQINVSAKKLRKNDITGHFSGHDNTLPKPDVGEAEGSSVRKRKRNSTRGKLPGTQ